MPQVSKEIIPESPATSLITYDRYPKQKINIFSATGFLERSLKCLRVSELINPKIKPINKESNPREQKSLTILNGVIQLISVLIAEYFITVLKRIIETASFMIPSPKTILKSFGYLS